MFFWYNIKKYGGNNLMKKIPVLVLSLIAVFFAFAACSKSSSPTAPAAEPTGNTPDEAIPLSMGASITGLTFDGACDKDWFKVSVTNGTAYVFRTFDLTTDESDPVGTGDTDTVLYVFDTAGKNALTGFDLNDIQTNSLTYNDDCVVNCGNDPEVAGYLSTVNYLADFTGTLYLLVMPIECEDGPDTVLANDVNPGYSFEVFEEAN
jgi:hypothetical protein